MVTSAGARKLTRAALWLLAGLVALVIVLVAAIHSRPAREYALRRAIATLQERYQIRLQARGLDYNLLELRATLHDVRASSISFGSMPFFSARRLIVQIPSSAIFGPFAIETIAIDDGQLRIVRQEDGRTNLPEQKGSSEEPTPLRLGSLIAPRLAIDLSDGVSRGGLVLPSVDIKLSPSAGRVNLREAGRVSRGEVTTAVRRIQGGIAFDGTRLHLASVTVETDELAAVLDGELAILVSEPAMSLRVGGRASAAQLARWGAVQDPPRAAIDFTAIARGPFVAPQVDANLASPRLDWRGARIDDVVVSLRATAARLDIQKAEAKLAGGSMSASASAPLNEGETHVHVSWRQVDLETLTKMLALRSAVRPSGGASGAFDAHGPRFDLEAWAGQADVDIDPGQTERGRIGVGGRVTLRVDRAAWMLASADGLTVGQIPLRATVGGRINADALERTTVKGAIELLPTPIAQVIDTMQRAGIGSLDVPDLAGTVVASAAVDGEVGRPRVAVEGTMSVADLAPLAPETALGGPAILSFTSDLRTARVKASARELNAFVDGTIALEEPYPATADLVVVDMAVSRLARGVDLPVPLDGTISVNVHAAGEPRRWERGRAEIEIRQLDASAGALPVRLASPARASVVDQVVTISTLEILAGQTRLSAAGRLPIRSGAPAASDAEALRVEATGDLAAFLNGVAATGVVTLPDIAGSGPAALLARITGSAEAPRISADLELGPGTVRAADLPPATNVRLQLHSDGSWIDLRELGADWLGARVTGRGHAPVAFDGRAATLEAKVTSVTSQVLAPFLDSDTTSQISGSVDASLQLRATALDLSAVSGEVRLDRMDLRIADLPVAQQEPTRVAIRDGQARVKSWRWVGQGGNIELLGQVRLSDRQAALIAGGRFDLRMLTPFTRAAGVALAGSLEPKLSVTGPIASPRIDGVASIVDAEIRLSDPRVVATNVDGRITLSGTRAQLTSLSGTINGGTLSAHGSVGYTPDRPVDGELAVGIRGMALEYPEGLRSEVDADLALAASLPDAAAERPAGTLSGTVTVVRSSYREPLAVATGLLQALRTRRLAAQVPAQPTLVDNLTLDVRVLTNEDVIVDNNVGRLQLGADLRVIGTAAAPALSGRAELREGGQLFLGRNRYEIESGTIDFANPVTIEPYLNVVANTRAGGQEITIEIKGTPEQQEVTLDSTTNPDLGEADLASLLLTGRTLNEISGNEAEIVGEQALAYLSGDFLGFAGRAVGLDTIRLGGVDDTVQGGDASAISAEIDPTARLTFGKSIGREFDVTFSQSLRDADAQTWIVDYRPRRQVEVRFISNDEDLRSYAFRHDVSFGNASTADAAVTRSSRPVAQRVTAVSIAGAKRVSEERLRSALRLQAGDPFDFAEWQRDRDRLETVLHQEGFYEGRIASRRGDEDGVALTFTVEEGPRTTIEVSGYELGGEALDRIRQAWSGAVFDQFLEEEAETIVRARLWSDGYFQSGVEASIVTGGEEKALRIQIAPGSQATVRRLRFDGVDGETEKVLEAWAAARPAFAEATGDPAAFSRTLTAWLRSRGHLRASVKIAPPLLENGEAIVPVRVDAGAVYTVNDVRFDGANALDQQTLRDIASLVPGDLFDTAAVDERRDRLRARYRREGFRAARVEVQSAIDDQARSVAITFAVSEGPRQVVREVDVQGNRTIDTDVITRALDLPSGEPAGADDWLQARRRLFDTGLFRRVDVTPEPLPVTTQAGEEPVRARVTVQEWPALRLRYGFQVAEERPEGEVEGRDLVPGLSADITRRTLFGRALTLGAAIDYQRRERRGRAFLTAPTMLGWPIESSVLVERSREEFSAVTLVTDLTAASWEQRFRFRRDLRLSYAYRFERNRTFDTQPLDPDFPFDLTVNVATLNTAAAWDRRDDAADTANGWLLSSSLDWAPASLGSQFRFTRYLAQAYYFRPWRGVVLASAARVGLAAPLGGQDLIPSERFFTGGSRTVRGVGEDRLGPRDALGDPAGGESLLVLNQEVRFPIYRWLRAVGFVDAGNVFADTKGIALGDLVESYGGGLRLVTPFALFRVDYGRLFSPRGGERAGRWYFGIGQAF